jgi:hypothetical protein
VGQLVCHKGVRSAVSWMKNKEPGKICIALSTWNTLSQDGK